MAERSHGVTVDQVARAMGRDPDRAMVQDVLAEGGTGPAWDRRRGRLQHAHDDSVTHTWSSSTCENAADLLGQQTIYDVRNGVEERLHR